MDLVNLVGVLDAEKLLQVAEFLPRRTCDMCVGAGAVPIAFGIADGPDGLEFGVILGPCEDCWSRGWCYILCAQ